MGVSHGYTNSQRLYTMGQADRGDASTVGVPVGQDPDLELGQGDIDVGEGRQPEAAGICAFFGGLLCYLFFCPCVGVCVCFNQLWAWITGEETGVTLEHPNSTTPLQLVRMDSNGTQAVDNMAKPGQVEVERMRRDLLKRQDPNQLVICRLCSGSGVLEVDLMTSPVACQMCAGSGTVSSWSSAFEAPEAEDDSSCPICFGPSKYGISTECSHFFCPDCIRGSLGAMLDQGVFPASCPVCRAEASTAGEKTPAAGHIEQGALVFLERCAVISQDFAFRFLRQQREATTQDLPHFFACPSGCGRHLRDQAPEFMIVARGETEATGFDRIMKLGECPCGARVCVVCHQLAEGPDPETGAYSHTCPDLDQAEERDEETQKVMEQTGKPCPNCGIFIQHNGGCHIIMCGTETHGRLADALRKGGCGYQFDWHTGQPVNSFYIGLNGLPTSNVVGKPKALTGDWVARNYSYTDDY